jgi:hypothetical protein
MLVTPWVAINFLGYRTYNPVDIMTAMFFRPPDQAAGAQIDLSLLRQNGTAAAASTASMASYIAAAAAAIAAASPLKRHRAHLALAAGVLAVSAGATWIYGIESLKDSISRAAAITGGIVGEEFRGREGDLAELFIVMETGPYITVVAGCVAASGYVTEKRAEAAGSFKKV